MRGDIVLFAGFEAHYYQTVLEQNVKIRSVACCVQVSPWLCPGGHE